MKFRNSFSNHQFSRAMLVFGWVFDETVAEKLHGGVVVITGLGIFITGFLFVERWDFEEKTSLRHQKWRVPFKMYQLK